jgi:hypothetical protein
MLGEWQILIYPRTDRGPESLLVIDQAEYATDICFASKHALKGLFERPAINATCPRWRRWTIQRRAMTI